MLTAKLLFWYFAADGRHCVPPCRHVYWQFSFFWRTVLSLASASFSYDAIGGSCPKRESSYVITLPL